MLTPKLNMPKLKANLSKFTDTNAQKIALQKQLNSAGPATIEELEIDQKKLLTQMMSTGSSAKLGWCNDPVRGSAIVVESGSGLPVLGFDGQLITRADLMSHPAKIFPESSYLALLESKGFEGLISHIYVDSTGHVTVGIGYMLAGETDVRAIASFFTHKKTNATASANDIAAEYHHVKKVAIPNASAEWFKKKTQYIFSTVKARQLAQSNVQEKQRHLLALSWFNAQTFDGLPAAVQMALTDMAYALGASKLDSSFPNLKDAMRHRDWDTASGECHIKTHPPTRNDQLKKWFQDAYRDSDEKFFIRVGSKRQGTAKQLTLKGTLSPGKLTP